MNVSFGDYIKSLETFIENKANSGEKISKEDFTNRSHYCSLIKYIDLLHQAVQSTSESDSKCFDRELLDCLGSVHNSVFKLFDIKCQQSDIQLPEVPIDTLELEKRLKRLKENDVDLPDVPVESVGIEELEKRLNELRSVEVRKTTPTKQQDILSKLADSIISNPHNQNIQQIKRAPERATEYNIHTIVEKINTYLKYLNIKGIHSKVEKYLFAEWLRVCHDKYIAEGKKNWVKWVATQVPLTRRQIDRYITYYKLINKYPKLLETTLTFSELVKENKPILTALDKVETDYWKYSTLL